MKNFPIEHGRSVGAAEYIKFFLKNEFKEKEGKGFLKNQSTLKLGLFLDASLSVVVEFNYTDIQAVNINDPCNQ